MLNADEMQYITDNLFVGNKLSTGQLRTSDGLRIDLRNIRSPIVVFCSWGDDITPPPQALDWILDLYGHEDEIIANGQTIVYTLHQTIATSASSSPEKWQPRRTPSWSSAWT